MNTNSNSYTIIYASVMVVIVAFLLAFVNSSLRDLQGKNVELDTKKQILSSLGITEVKDADAEFSKVVKSDMIVDEDGSLKEYDGKFVTAYEKEFKETVVLTYSYVKSTVRLNMLFLFTVPDFGVLSGAM